MANEQLMAADYLAHYLSKIVLVFLGFILLIISVIGLIYSSWQLFVFGLVSALYATLLAIGTDSDGYIRMFLRSVGAVNGPSLEEKEEKMRNNDLWGEK